MRLLLLCVFGFSVDFSAKCQQSLYGLKGTSIRLSLGPRNQSHKLKNVVWRRFNKRDLLANGDGVPSKFVKRISLNQSDWSLTVHHLQENDTGLYQAFTNFEEDILAAYSVTVENSVSEPEITVSPHDVNSSACRAAVNCSVEGSWTSYDCDQGRCMKTHASQSSSINISLAVLDSRDFQCHASNHVSRNQSPLSNFTCHEKLQSDLRSPPVLVSWIAVTAGVGVALGLFMGLIAVVVKKRRTSKVHPQSSHVVIDRGLTTVIEQHQDTIYSTVGKPNASQNPPGNTTDSNTEGTIYDTPSRRPKVCQVNSEAVMTDHQERQRSGPDRTVQVRATVHQAAEPDSEQMNTVYCKLGEM